MPKAEKDIVDFVGLPMFRIWKKTESFIEARVEREGTYLYHCNKFIKENKEKLEKIYSKGRVAEQEPISEA